MDKHDPNHKGNVAELAIAFEAAKLGLTVLKPLTEHVRYDLVLEIGGQLMKVQCKWGSLKGEVICVRVSSSYHSPTRGYVKSTYDESQVDLVAVFCGGLGASFLLPADLVSGRSTLHLRVGRAKNNQRAALNWAADYEFHGAVAQLAERSNGIRKAEGSNPSSSTPDIAAAVRAAFGRRGDFSELPSVVGMDAFYAKLAQYVRRAEAGEETLITRRGKPVACLVPVLSHPAATAPGLSGPPLPR